MDTPEIPHKKRRVFFYVDGFNLYYRRLELNPSLKWLCLRTLASVCIFPTDEVVKIKYFTAKVDPRFPGSAKQIRQTTYWDALRNNGVEIIEGVLEPRDRQCKSLQCDLAYNKKPESKYSTMAEKMTDVNLALHVYRDFIEQKPDIVCVLSADLDILPVLKMIRDKKEKVMLQVILPTQDEGLFYSRLLFYEQVAILKKLSDTHLKKSQFPEQVQISAGVFRNRPTAWC